MTRSQKRLDRSPESSRKTHTVADTNLALERMTLLSDLDRYQAAKRQFEEMDFTDEDYDAARLLLRDAAETACEAIRRWHGLSGNTGTPTCAVQVDGILYVAYETVDDGQNQYLVMEIDLADAPIIKAPAAE